MRLGGRPQRENSLGFFFALGFREIRSRTRQIDAWRDKNRWQYRAMSNRGIAPNRCLARNKLKSDVHQIYFASDFKKCTLGEVGVHMTKNPQQQIKNMISLEGFKKCTLGRKVYT